VSDQKVKPEGTNVRCTRCGHVFVAHPEDDVSAFVGTTNRDLDASARQPDGDGQQPVDPSGANEQAEKQPKRKNTKRIWVLLVVLILAAALGGYVYWPDYRAWLFSESAQETDKAALSQKTDSFDPAEEIGLQNVRQYMVDNETMGRILVIEGQAVNVSGKDPQEITLLASLFDHQGQKIGEQEFRCTNTASLEQLQNLTRQELLELLSTPKGGAEETSQIPAGQAVPFMIFFDQYPDQVAEFSLDVVQ
jgi:hypothetical protein